MDVIFETCNFLWNRWTALTGWQMALWIVWLIYFLIRTYHYWSEADDHGFQKGYREAAFGTDTHIRLWHIVRMVIDLPSAIIGLFLPFIRSALSLKIYEFKKGEKDKELTKFQDTL